MRFSLEWLREFVAVDVSPQELAERLTLAGIEVGSWEQSAPPAGPCLPRDVSAAVLHQKPMQR